MGGSGIPTDATPLASAQSVKALQDQVGSIPTLNEGQSILQRLSRLEIVRITTKWWEPSDGISPWVVVKLNGTLFSGVGLVKLYRSSSLSESSVVGMLCKLQLDGNMISILDFEGKSVSKSLNVTVYNNNLEEIVVTKDTPNRNYSYTLFSVLL